MNTAQLALVVACLSALFTGLNMLASWLTFRRAKPRVRMKIDPDMVFTPHDPKVHLEIRFINRSASPISVESVTFFQDNVRYAILKEMNLESVDSEGGKEVPAFGGLLWKTSIPINTYMPMRGLLKHEWIVAQLSNGTIVHPNWFDRSKARRSLHTLYRYHRQSLREIHRPSIDSGVRQLSFDDMED
ncbi:hypothetical protein AB0G86_25065 [Streptomyces scabiei]|uniref:hypothetical protein n=1 Tax=Streptomyces scabiei TaxID=1930 RepID=UPI0033CD7B6B